MNKPCPSLAGIRVLVVEDNYFIATELKWDLTTCGAEVIGPVGQLENAVMIAAESDFDVACIDIGLADGQTYAVARTIQRRNLPFIFVTGYSAETIPTQFAHVHRFQKPSDFPAVAGAIKALCST